jgi:serine/threonine protein kinase
LAGELVVALEYLRAQQIVHRDLKPGNILLDADFHIKLIDFATSKILNPQLAKRIPKTKSKPDQTLKLPKQNQITDSPLTDEESDLNRYYSMVGTEEYVAPEILKKQEVSYATDLWSLGIIIYQLLVGSTPFKGNSEYLTFENILNEEVKFPENLDISEDAKDLIVRLLEKTPCSRLGAQNFEELKNHNFFKGVDFS